MQAFEAMTNYLLLTHFTMSIYGIYAPNNVFIALVKRFYNLIAYQHYFTDVHGRLRI